MRNGSLVFLLLLGSITECSQFFKSHKVRRWKQGDKIRKPSILMIRNAAHDILPDKEPKLDKAQITDEGRLEAGAFGEQLKKMPPNNFISCPASNCIDTIQEIMKSAGVDETKYTKDKLLSYTSFYSQHKHISNLIKRFGRKEFYEDFLQYWLDGAEAQFLHLKDEQSDYILEKHSYKLEKDLTLMVAHGFTIEAIARAGGLPAEGPGPSDWSKHLEGIIITRKKHQEL